MINLQAIHNLTKRITSQFYSPHLYPFVSLVHKFAANKTNTFPLKFYNPKERL